MKQQMMTGDELRVAQAAKPQNKYHAKHTIIVGLTFPSQAQAARYVELRQEEDSGCIDRLNPHPPTYRLEANGRLIGRYTPDFIYRRGEQWVTEDVKGGPVSRDVPLRLKLMEACHGIKVQIIRMERRRVESLLALAAVQGRMEASK